MLYRFIGLESVLQSHDNSHASFHFKGWGTQYDVPQELAESSVRDLGLRLVPEKEFTALFPDQAEVKKMISPEAQARRGTDEFKINVAKVEQVYRDFLASLKATKPQAEAIHQEVTTDA